jgi:hypothetical protein
MSSPQVGQNERGFTTLKTKTNLPMTQLPFLTTLRLEGADAASFLQGQLTSDVRQLSDGRTQLAAANTPQGRVVALLRLRQHGEAIHALLPRELAAPLSAQLKRYVLRSKVRIEVDDRPVAWLDGHAPAPDGALVFQYDPARRVALLPAGTALTDAGPDAEARWLAADVAAGQPQVGAATSGQFVAQMLNLDLLDGISFQKGCYTGQEIVARTQHLGRIKRRLLRYRAAAGPLPAPLAALLQDGQKVGEVLSAAPAGDGIELLAVTSLEAASRPLSLEDGRALEALPLPYPTGA